MQSADTREIAQVGDGHDPSSARVTTRSDGNEREVDRSGGPFGGDPLAALASSIANASAAGQWDVVRALARQLEALTAGPNVVELRKKQKT